MNPTRFLRAGWIVLLRAYNSGATRTPACGRSMGAEQWGLGQSRTLPERGVLDGAFMCECELRCQRVEPTLDGRGGVFFNGVQGSALRICTESKGKESHHERDVLQHFSTG